MKAPHGAGLSARLGGVLRIILVWIAIVAFACLGVVDLVQHNYRIGAASIMLACVNLLLLT